VIAGTVIATTTVNATTGLITLNSYAVGNVSTCSGNTSIQCSKNSDCSGNGFCNWCNNNNAIGCAADLDCGAGNKCISATAHGDPDGFADAAELINLTVVLANKSGLDVDDITATLGTVSPNIECITRASILVGSLKNKELRDPVNYLPFQFKVKDTVNRTDPFATLQAKFTITIRSSKFDALTRATEFTLDLDLNASGGGTTIGYSEDFEATAAFPGNFGTFTREFLDASCPRASGASTTTPSASTPRAPRIRIASWDSPPIFRPAGTTGTFTPREARPPRAAKGVPAPVCSPSTWGFTRSNPRLTTRMV
jgi:hypothetical protein